jgi:hypothetical protein
LGVNWLVVALALGSAWAFAVSTTLKNSSASDAPSTSRRAGGSLAGFVRATVNHPRWLAGLVADAVGLCLQVVALHLGALALVQPLMVSGLLFALLLRHRHHLRGISSAELRWACLLTAGLAAFLLLSGAASGSLHPEAADRLPAIIAAAVGVLTGIICLSAARHSIPAATRAALIGIAVGAVYAATAALIKASTDIAATAGAIALLAHWQPYTLIVVGGLGLFLTQLAFQAGPLTASLPAISTVDPLLSIALGVLVYDEHLHRGPLGGTVLAGLLLLLALAVIQLGRLDAPAPAAAPGHPR